MKALLETDIKNGGVSTFENSSMFRVIAVPEDLKIWICVPGFYGWTEINLKLFFES